MKIKNRIAEIMDFRTSGPKLKSVDMASYLGVSKQRVNHWRDNAVQPRATKDEPELIKKICEFLQAPEEDVFYTVNETENE